MKVLVFITIRINLSIIEIRYIITLCKDFAFKKNYKGAWRVGFRDAESTSSTQKILEILSDVDDKQELREIWVTLICAIGDDYGILAEFEVVLGYSYHRNYAQALCRHSICHVKSSGFYFTQNQMSENFKTVIFNFVVYEFMTNQVILRCINKQQQNFNASEKKFNNVIVPIASW